MISERILNRDQSANLSTVKNADFLPPISPWLSWGGLCLVGTVGAAFTLAAIFTYNVTVNARATIRPSGEQRLVQVATEGTVKTIEVKENQQVEQGDIIATIDDSRLQTQKSQLQSNIQQNQRQLTQIDAQIMALDQQIIAERDRTKRTVASAQAELSRSQREYQDQQITATAQVQEAEAHLKQAQEELQRSEAELNAAQAHLNSTEAALNAAKARRDRYQPIAESGALSQDQFQEVQLAVTQQEQALEAQKATILAQKEEIERLSSGVDAAQARRKGALAALNPSEAMVTMAKEKIAQERATGKASLSRLNQEREQLIQRRGELLNQLSRNKDELQQIETELQNTMIRASASGIIQQLHLRNVQQVVRAGDAIAQISPSAAPLVIKAFVSSQDISQVEMGQRVQMRVSACPYPDYGTLPGTVTAISPDVTTPTLTPQAIASSTQTSTTSANHAVYEVTIQPGMFQLSEGERPCVIQSGMEGRADIIATEETVLNLILTKTRLLTNF